MPLFPPENDISDRNNSEWASNVGLLREENDLHLLAGWPANISPLICVIACCCERDSSTSLMRFIRLLFKRNEKIKIVDISLTQDADTFPAIQQKSAHDEGVVATMADSRRLAVEIKWPAT